MFSGSRNPIHRPALVGWAALLRLLALLAMLAAVAPIALAQSLPASSRFEPAPSEPGVVNLNTASLDELTRLPGIGPARARAVLELRRKLTRFSRLEDLMRVKGIGRKTFRKLQPLLRLSGTTTLLERGQRPCPQRAAGDLAPITRVVRAGARSALA